MLKYTTNESEEVRSAAAFAAGASACSAITTCSRPGNMAVGAPDAFLPGLVKQISAAGTEADRILFLHALKEVS